MDVSVNVDPTAPSEIQQQATAGERFYALAGMAVSALLAVAGVVLVILGFSGSVDFGFTVGGASAHVVTGSIGIVVVIVGAGIIWATRYTVTVTTQASGREPKVS